MADVQGYGADLSGGVRIPTQLYHPKNEEPEKGRRGLRNKTFATLSSHLEYENKNHLVLEMGKVST